MKLGFIGCGNMAQAMITGILTQKVVSPQELIVSNPREEKTAKLKDEFGIITTTDNKEVAKQSDILVLSVKPQVYPAVIKEIRDEVSSEQIIVTIAAGVSMEAAERQFGKEVKIVRVMPNTPALVGEGMSGLCCNEYVTEEEFDLVHKIFESFGKAEKITENLMDAVVGVSGSGPAYVYMFIERSHKNDVRYDSKYTWGNAFKSAIPPIPYLQYIIVYCGLHYFWKRWPTKTKNDQFLCGCRYLRRNRGYLDSNVWR